MSIEQKIIAEKILTCGVIPVRFAWGEWRLLVLKTKGIWDFPARLITLHEDSLSAAQRHATALTGIADWEFVFGEDYKETLADAAHRISRYYVAETRSEEQDFPNEAVVDNVDYEEGRWVSCLEAEDYLPPRLAHILEWVNRVINEK